MKREFVTVYDDSSSLHLQASVCDFKDAVNNAPLSFSSQTQSALCMYTVHQVQS